MEPSFLLESKNFRITAKLFCKKKPIAKFFLTLMEPGFHPESKYFRIIAKLHFANISVNWCIT